MSQLLKLLTLLALIATLPSPTQASPTYPYAPASAPETRNDDPFSPLPYSPSPSYENDLSPEPQYPSDEEVLAPEYQYPPSPLAYAPDIEEDYPYAENPSFSPSQPPYLDTLAPDAQDVDDGDLYYSSYEAPSPMESTYSGVSDTPADGFAPQAHATPTVLPFNYSAEDDAGELISEDNYDEEGYPELNKKNRAVIGFVIGATCLVGLGGLVYKKRKNQKRNHPMYVQLSKKEDV